MKIVRFLSLYIIFYNQCDYTINALIGPNVRNAMENEFPYIVSLVHFHPLSSRASAHHVCTGSLITTKDVATSSHCIIDQDINTVLVHHGSIDLASGRKSYIYWWITYDHWATQMNLELEFSINDVANIRLLRAVSNIAPLPISNAFNRQIYRQELIVAGWSMFNTTALGSMLRTVTLSVLTNNQCIRRISAIAHQLIIIDERHLICTVGNPYALLYYGDSGGPLVYNNELVGINKGGCPTNIEDTNPELVNIHMSMQYYKHFYLQIIISEND